MKGPAGESQRKYTILKTTRLLFSYVLSQKKPSQGARITRTDLFSILETQNSSIEKNVGQKRRSKHFQGPKV